MAFKVNITYDATKDILNVAKDDSAVVTSVCIPGLASKKAPSDAYIYAPDGSTTPYYNKECICTTNGQGTISETDTYKTASFLTSSQRRWPKTKGIDLMKILEAYATPQIPVYRAWQTFKLAVESGNYEFTVDTFAESEFYREAGIALKNYGIEVEISGASAAESSGVGT